MRYETCQPGKNELNNNKKQYKNSDSWSSENIGLKYDAG